MPYGSHIGADADRTKSTMTIQSIRQQIETISASVNASADKVHLIPTRLHHDVRGMIAAISAKLDAAARLIRNVEHRMSAPDVENTEENESVAIHVERVDEVVAKADEMAQRLANGIAKLTA